MSNSSSSGESAHDVGEEIQRQVQVLVQDPDVEAGGFLAGEGVHLSAHGIDLPGDLESRALLRPLEDQMLDEVRDPALLPGLVPGAPP